MRRPRHGFPRRRTVSAADADMRAVEGEDAVVSDADSVCVACEVREHLGWAAERRLGINDPVLRPGSGDGVAEGERASKVGGASREPELAPVAGLGEFLEKAAAEQAGEDLDGGQEPPASDGPFARGGVEAGVGDDHVQVRMPEEPLVPDMQDAGSANAPPEARVSMASQISPKRGVRPQGHTPFISQFWPEKGHRAL